MNKKETSSTKLQEVIKSSIENDMATIVASNKSAKAASKEKKTNKESSTAASAAQATPDKKEKKTKKEKAVQEAYRAQNTAILEQVVSTREVKYIYPADVNDPISRKRWRQGVRNKLHTLEREMYRIQDKESKEYKKALKAYTDYQKTVLKPAQTA